MSHALLKAARPTIEFEQHEAASMAAKWPLILELRTDNVNASADNIFAYYFLDAFPALPAGSLDIISLGGAYLAAAIVGADPIFDRAELTCDRTLSERVIRSHVLQFEAVLSLGRVFPPDSAFWNDYRRLYGEYIASIIAERAIARGSQPLSHFDFPLAERVAIGKSALSRLAISALAALTGQGETAQRLDRSLKHYLFARQLYDDLRDWKEDLSARLPSLVLSAVLTSWPAESESMDKIALARLSKRIHYEGHSTALLDAAVVQLDLAAPLAREAPHFRGEIDRFRGIVTGMRDDIAAIREKNLRRARTLREEAGLPDLETMAASDRVVERALGYLVRQWRLGFGEARHLMLFDLERTGVEDVQSGDVFQRAIVVDALHDAMALTGLDLRATTDAESDYLIEQRRTTRAGGWAYFPAFKPLPSDADDVAQVMIALLRSGRGSEVDAYCAPAVQFLFEECAHPDGSFETWLLPRESLDDEERYQRHCAENYWGTGPDPEVVANLLYALSLYDARRYAEVIERGCAYLARVQEPDGSWRSTWYHGPYYGAYVCTRALALRGAFSPALRSAERFLLDSRKADGSWGLGSEGDPLSTAFALIALSQVRTLSGNPQLGEALESGRRYLARAQEGDGSWPAVDFIRMELGRAKNNVFCVLTYRSRTIATAFAVKALACARM